MKLVKKVLVIGSEPLAKNIAFAFTKNSDIEVTVFSSRVQDIWSGIYAQSQQAIEKKVMTIDELENRLSRITLILAVKPLNIGNADLVIEATSDNQVNKMKILAELDESCSKETILCSNISDISPSEFGETLVNRSRFIGLNFLTPADINPLVEVIKTDATSVETANAVLNLLKSIEKIPILCHKDPSGHKD